MNLKPTQGTNDEVSLTSNQQAILDEVYKQTSTLHEIEQSRSWRIIRMIWRNPWYLFIRKVLMGMYEQLTQIRGKFDSIKITNTHNNDIRFTQDSGSTFTQTQLRSEFSRNSFSSDEISWLEEIRKKQPEAIAVLHPEWRGIHAATEELFLSLLNIPDTLDPITALHYADLLAETKCPRIVFSGFPIAYRYLVLALKKRLPKLQLYVLYHGSFNQYREDYDRNAFATIIELSKTGKLNKVGFVKAGMAETVNAALGLSTGFVMNFMAQIPSKASNPLPDGPHLGMWLLWSGNWQKPPFSMMAACNIIPGSILHGSDMDERMASFAKIFQLRTEFVGKPLPRNQLLQHMAMMHLNLYVTFHECAPMQPLESLSVGVPCLLGPISHYFEDHSFLHERLVVPYPDRTEVIARQAIKAIEDRDEIIRQYQAYAPEYNERAKSTLRRFLEVG